MKRMTVALTLAMTTMVGFGAEAAHATVTKVQSETVDASISSVRQHGVLWLDTTVAVNDRSRLSIEILAPGRGSTHSLWQRCAFSMSEAGTYRCGIDTTSELTPAGRWISRAFVDGRLAATKSFRV